MTVYIVMRNVAGGDDAEVCDVFSEIENAETVASGAAGPPRVKGVDRSGVVTWRDSSGQYYWIEGHSVR